MGRVWRRGWLIRVWRMFRRCSGVVSVVVWSENKTVSEKKFFSKKNFRKKIPAIFF